MVEKSKILVYSGLMSFYVALRQALSIYEPGLHSVGKPASPKQLAEAEKRLGGPLPKSYQDFLSSFDGAVLFHESIHLFSTSDTGLRGQTGGYIRIGEIPQGALWMNDAGAIKWVDEDTPDPMIIGSNLEHFLDAMIAREALVIDLHGEFREVFDEGGELNVNTRKKQARVGQKRDPSVAFYFYEQAELFLMEANPTDAIPLLQKAIDLDPNSGPCFELLGSLYREQERLEQAEYCFFEAAKAALDPTLKASRFLQAAALATPPRQSEYVEATWSQDPTYAHSLLNQTQSLLKENPEEAQKRLAQMRLLILHAPSLWKRQAEELQQQLTSVEQRLRIRSRLNIL